MRKNKQSMLGADYPLSPSNMTTAAIINNHIGEERVNPSEIGHIGPEDIVALTCEVFSISLVACAYKNGDLDELHLPIEESLNSISALNTIKNSPTLTDEAFFEAYQQVVYIWPEICKADFDYTMRSIENAKKSAAQQGENPDFAVINNSMVKNHMLDTLDASELLNSISNYGHRIIANARDRFKQDL